MQFIGFIPKNTQPSLEVKSLPEKQFILNYLPWRGTLVVSGETGEILLLFTEGRCAIHSAINIYFVGGRETSTWKSLSAKEASQGGEREG